MQRLPKTSMSIIAVVQGFALYGLYHAFDTKQWPSDSPLWSFPLWTIAIAVPMLLLLSISRENFKRAAKHVGIFGLILALLATYIGYQAMPVDAFRLSSLTYAFVFSIALACFKGLMYLQQRADQVPLTYPILFTNSWRNFLVTALSAVFVLVFWWILLLWGQLFKVIEIDFFQELFTEDWFIIPTLSVAFGAGVIIFRGLTNVIDNITRLLHWLFKMLLPLVVFIAVLFIGALPFVGIDVLWDTGRGTSLLLWLLALMLFFTNAVYQDGREANPYPDIVHRLIFGGLCVMPVIAGLSLYGLALRLIQYGWTVERCWAFVVWLILSLFAVGYVVGIVRRRDRWTNELARVNTAMGVVVLAIMLLANSPLLDFRKISLASQLQRVESGEIELRDFDFWYTRQHLARPGFLAMEQMKQDLGDSDSDLLALIENPVNTRYGVRLQNVAEMWKNMRFRPEPFTVPEALKPLIEIQRQRSGENERTLIRIDLDEDGKYEYALLTNYNGYLGYPQFFYRSSDGWKTGSFQRLAARCENDLDTELKNGAIETAQARFRQLNVGKIALQPFGYEPESCDE